MKTLVVLALSCAALSGCQTVQEMQAQDYELCESYGAPFGTDAHYQCRMAQQQRRDVQQAETAAMLSDLGRDIANTRW